jgi:hypothetical protein
VRGDEFLDRPAALVAAAIGVGAYGRDLAAVLQEGERRLPGLAGLLIHDEMMAQADGAR